MDFLNLCAVCRYRGKSIFLTVNGSLCETCRLVKVGVFLIICVFICVLILSVVFLDCLPGCALGNIEEVYQFTSELVAERKRIELDVNVREFLDVAEDRVDVNIAFVKTYKSRNKNVHKEIAEIGVGNQLIDNIFERCAVLDQTDNCRNYSVDCFKRSVDVISGKRSLRNRNNLLNVCLVKLVILNLVIGQEHYDDINDIVLAARKAHNDLACIRVCVKLESRAED